MYNVTIDYKNSLKSDEQTYDVYLVCKDGVRIEGSGKLSSISYNDAHFDEKIIGNFIKREFKLSVLDDNLNLTDKEVDIFIGLKVKGIFEYVPFGTFRIIRSAENDKANEETTITAEDLTYKFNKKVNVTLLNNATTIFELYRIICTEVAIECGNASFTNGTYSLKNIYYDPSSTYRDIIKQIAEVSVANAKIGRDNKLYIKETNMDLVKKVEKNEQFEQKKSDLKFGPINAVVASRIQADDGSTTEDTYARNEESIVLNGINEVKIVANDLIENNRQIAVDNMLTKINDFTYTPTELEIVLDPALDAGDYIEIADVKTNTTYKTVVQNLSFDLATGLMKINSSAKTKTQTDYASATNKDKRKITELKVNKLDGKITGVVEEQTILKNEVNDTVKTIKSVKAELLLDIDGLTNTFAKSGGSNLLENSSGQFGNKKWYDVVTSETAKIQAFTDTAIKNTFVA
ncbi:MAG: hypothetical protein RR662_07775, partial [Clostridia bacterium]